MFIAHAESKQRVKFWREHVVAAWAEMPMNRTGNKSKAFVFIISLGDNYTKKATAKKEKNKKYFSLTKPFGLSKLLYKVNLKP